MNNIYNNTSSAYDLSYFYAERKHKSQISDKNKNLKVKKQSKPMSKEELRIRRRINKKRIFSVLLIASIIFSAFSCVIVQKVKYFEATKEVAQLSAELSNLQSEEISLQSKLIEKSSIKNIQQYAEEELGMSKANVSSIRYIEVKIPDKNEEKNKKSGNIIEKIKEKIED